MESNLLLFQQIYIKIYNKMGTFVIYFNVNFNVLKQIYCALVGIIKVWINQNAEYNCGKKKKSGMTGSVATVREKKKVHIKFCLENQKGGNHSGTLRVNYVVIIK
jgi:hypothetical protein